MLSAFTYSKAINDLPEICCAAPFAQNSYDLAAERGVADFNQKLRWVLSFDYEIPFGGSHSHLDNRVVNAVLGGWRIGGIYTLASGFPFSAFQADDPSNTGSQGIPAARSAKEWQPAPRPAHSRSLVRHYRVSPCSRTTLFGLATPRATA